MLTIRHADSGDWIGVYIDGRLVYQGHDIEPGHLLDLAGVEHREEHNVPLEASGRFVQDA